MLLCAAEAPQGNDGEIHVVRRGGLTKSAVFIGSTQLTQEVQKVSTIVGIAFRRVKYNSTLSGIATRWISNPPRPTHCRSNVKLCFKVQATRKT